jgi:hypothetical protein
VAHFHHVGFLCDVPGMLKARKSGIWRHVRRLMALVLVLHVILPAGLAAARLAERLELQALGLLDTVNCHSDGPTKGDMPGQRPTHDASCECCLTGCGTSGPAAPPLDRGAINRPLRAANSATRVALDAVALRTYASERTRSPRSPPVLS